LLLGSNSVAVELLLARIAGLAFGIMRVSNQQQPTVSNSKTTATNSKSTATNSKSIAISKPTNF